MMWMSDLGWRGEVGGSGDTFSVASTVASINPPAVLPAQATPPAAVLLVQATPPAAVLCMLLVYVAAVL